MNTFLVPTVDISAYVQNGSPAARAAVARQVDAACRDVGFIQIVGHGVDPDLSAHLASAMDAFFGLPLTEKRAWIRPAAENRGYTPPRSETLALSAGTVNESRMKDFFEAYNVGTTAADQPSQALPASHYATNTWPAVPGFEAAVDAWRARMASLARTLVEIFEDALGLDRGDIAGLCRHPIEVLRMNNYALPEHTRVEVGEEMVGMGEHTDFGIVTILWADRVRGLQVLSDGTWHDVSPQDGALLINLGDLTARLTNERWLSTLHRVKPPIVDGTIRRRRSAAYFFDGDADAVVGPLDRFVDEDHPALYAPVTVDQHVRAKLAGSRVGVLNPDAGREAARILTAAG